MIWENGNYCNGLEFGVCVTQMIGFKSWRARVLMRDHLTKGSSNESDLFKNAPFPNSWPHGSYPEQHSRNRPRSFRTNSARVFHESVAEAGCRRTLIPIGSDWLLPIRCPETWFPDGSQLLDSTDLKLTSFSAHKQMILGRLLPRNLLLLLQLAGFPSTRIPAESGA
jgi:hypothetical protein